MVKELQGMPNLKAIIKRSHERSASYGVDPNALASPESSRLTGAELQSRIENQREYYTIAKEQLDSLYRLLKDTGFCMALADGEGYILYVVGDPDLVEHFKRRRCLPGYRWTERDIGTCAIGLALEERSPIFLPGESMFASLAQGISNAGAPVYSTDGRDVIGVVSLSGYSEKMHVHTLGLVRQAAETVTAHLREIERIRELDVQNRYMDAIVNSSSRGMITVDREGRIVQLNQRARLLVKLDQSAVGRLISECFGGNFDISDNLTSGQPFNSREFITKHDGVNHFVSFDPIRNDTGKLVGGLLTVIEKKEIYRVAAEMSGSHAHFTFNSIIGESSELLEAIRVAKIAASGAAAVMLAGETGTGKELFAQAIHNESDRKNMPFIAINCGAIPKELLESELFGYEEGAFTGAQKGGRPGKFELADNGTLFLDEIGDMPIDMQVKILRVLQTGELQRVGGLRTVPVNLRVISATHKDLKQAIDDCQFREDLYYRICTLKIEVPPLRRRGEDVLMLAQHFLRRHVLNMNKRFSLDSSGTREALINFNWPGNIRQLEGAVERAVHMAQGEELEPAHFGIKADSNGKRQEEETYGRYNLRTLAEIESEVLQETLSQCDGNIQKCSNILGISRPTIYRKLKKYGIEAEGV